MWCISWNFHLLFHCCFCLYFSFSKSYVCWFLDCILCVLKMIAFRQLWSLWLYQQGLPFEFLDVGWLWHVVQNLTLHAIHLKCVEMATKFGHSSFNQESDVLNFSLSWKAWLRWESSCFKGKITWERGIDWFLRERERERLILPLTMWYLLENIVFFFFFMLFYNHVKPFTNGGANPGYSWQHPLKSMWALFILSVGAVLLELYGYSYQMTNLMEWI